MSDAKKLGILICLLSVGVALLVAGLPDDTALRALESIRAADLKSSLHFLASDEMQGRETNSLFNEIASRYLAHRFELMGLSPAGDNQSYFQYFALVQALLSQPNSLEIKSAASPLITTALLKEDFFPSPLSASGKVTAPVLFAGYGISAAEHHYDDYRGTDAQGKIVLVIHHEPGENDAHSPFDGLVNSDYGRDLHKILNAQNHGAVGVILIEDQANHQRPDNFSREARAVWPEEPSRGRYSLEIWAEQVRIPAVNASRKIAAVLLQNGAVNLAAVQKEIDSKLTPNSFPLEGVTATLHTSVVQKSIRIRNVVGAIPGSDPVLKDEVVIVGAHFDHDGTRDGRVYNGADDDGSGTVGLLEIAEAFALSPVQPKRTVLLAAWNAEERGLLGSYYYVERPLFPLPKTVAMLQMDMIGRNEEVPDPNSRRFRGLEKQSPEQNANSLNVLGYSRSEDLRRLVVEHNQLTGLELKFRYDNHPQNLLRRSDHWPFLIRGVPALFFHTGLHPDYHTPEDTPDKINYAKMEKIVRLVFLCAWTTAHASTLPKMNAGKHP